MLLLGFQQLALVEQVTGVSSALSVRSGSNMAKLRLSSENVTLLRLRWCGLVDVGGVVGLDVFAIPAVVVDHLVRGRVVDCGGVEVGRVVLRHGPVH